MTENKLSFFHKAFKLKFPFFSAFGSGALIPADHYGFVKEIWLTQKEWRESAIITGSLLAILLCGYLKNFHARDTVENLRKQTQYMLTIAICLLMFCTVCFLIFKVASFNSLFNLLSTLWLISFTFLYAIAYGAVTLSMMSRLPLKLRIKLED